MRVEQTSIKGLKVVQPRIFGDDRGYFFETYNQRSFEEQGLPGHFVQDNQSLSQQGVLRGLHFQAPPHAQGKLVRVIKGAVRDVAVDIRRSSPTYGQFHALDLTEENKTQFYIPPGFAHGFLTLVPDTIFAYKCTDLYHPETEGSIRWDDAGLDIDWNLDTLSSKPILSDKDREAPFFQNFKSPFD